MRLTYPNRIGVCLYMKYRVLASKSSSLGGPSSSSSTGCPAARECRREKDWFAAPNRPLAFHKSFHSSSCSLKTLRTEE